MKTVNYIRRRQNYIVTGEHFKRNFGCQTVSFEYIVIRKLILTVTLAHRLPAGEMSQPGFQVRISIIDQGRKSYMMAPHKINDITTCSGFYDRYAPALYGVILKHTTDVEKAANILENSFIKFWQLYDRYDLPKGRLFSFMLRITLQQCNRELGYSKKVFQHLAVNAEHTTRLHEKMQQ